MPEWRPLPVGTLFRDRYDVEAISGRGGFGATYRVRDRERFQQLCALKELLPSQGENPKVRELFEREARTLLALRHPGIPALHSFFSHDGRYYLVEDFVTGRTLAQEMEERGRFSEVEVVVVLDEILAILEYLHGRSPALIHRDIKPANIIRGADGTLYLVDFGAVKEAMVVAVLSAESTIIGTSGYTPPEQLRGIVVPASDLYAVGATALQLVSGRPPAEWYDALNGSWRFPGQLGVSARLEGVLVKLLEEQPARRYHSARAVRDALRQGGAATAASRTLAILQPEPLPQATAPAPATRPSGAPSAPVATAPPAAAPATPPPATAARPSTSPPPTSTPSTLHARWRLPIWSLVATAAMAVGAVGVSFLMRSSPPPPPAVTSSPPAATAVAPAPAPPTPVTPPVTAAAPPTPTSRPAPPPAPPSQPAPVPAARTPAAAPAASAPTAAPPAPARTPVPDPPTPAPAPSPREPVARPPAPALAMPPVAPQAARPTSPAPEPTPPRVSVVPEPSAPTPPPPAPERPTALERPAAPDRPAPPERPAALDRPVAPDRPPAPEPKSSTPPPRPARRFTVTDEPAPQKTARVEPVAPSPPAQVAAPEPQGASAVPSRAFRAPLDRVWTTTESVLKSLGWEIDERDRKSGTIQTVSRRIEASEDFGVYTKEMRHRLRVRLTETGEGQTRVTVERLVFRRERVLWVNNDQTADVPRSQINQGAAQEVLAALGREL
jgi:serine/threonine protein kinase